MHTRPAVHAAIWLPAMTPQGSPSRTISSLHAHAPLPLPRSKHALQVPGFDGLQKPWHRPAMH
jgi:hypothetical protein